METIGDGLYASLPHSLPIEPATQSQDSSPEPFRKPSPATLAARTASAVLKTTPISPGAHTNHRETACTNYKCPNSSLPLFNLLLSIYSPEKVPGCFAPGQPRVRKSAPFRSRAKTSAKRGLVAGDLPAEGIPPAAPTQKTSGKSKAKGTWHEQCS